MPRLLLLFLFAFILSLSVPVHAAGLDRLEMQAALNEVLDSDPTARRTTVALQVVDSKSGQVLYDRHGDRLLTPASNLKIYTSACALDLFGPKHCFPTRISAKVDEATGAIRGNLTLVGGGNAMLSSSELLMLADRVVKEWGVRSLHGKVIVDNLRYSSTRLGPGWMWDDQPYYFNMRITPLMVDFNVRTLHGKLNQNGNPVRLAVNDPQIWIASKFTEMLRQSGVKIVQGSQNQGAATVKRTIKYAGTPLAVILKHFNHVSENAVGEVLLHEIAIAKGKLQPSWSAGAEVITTWLHETVGLEKGSFRLVDGSGLSRYNLISADSSVKLLAFMRRNPHYQVFVDSLPVYGVKTRTGVKQMRVHGKSGGMSGVSTISGYLETLEGRQLIFSMLGNGFIGSQEPVKALRGKVWRVLVRYRADR